jgi:hypothetical protein
MPHRQARGENDRHGRLQRRVPLPASASQAGAVTGEQPGLGWTLALRRQPIRIVDGQPPGGYTDLYELICCYCGDDPDLDYQHVPPELQRIRGPYPGAAGITACGRHARHHRRQATALGEQPARGRS